MGYSKNLFIGACIELPTKKKEVKSDVKTCPNEDCENHKRYVSFNYCNYCGSKVDLIEVISYKSLSLFDLHDQINDRLINVGHFWYSDNEKQYAASNYTDETLLFHDDEPDGEILQVSEKIKQDCIDAFRAKFEKEINLLSEYFGQPLPVKFGIVFYKY